MLEDDVGECRRAEPIPRAGPGDIARARTRAQGARYGILGVAVAQLVVTTASTFLNLYVAGRIVSLPATSLLREFRTAAIGSLVMVVTVQLVQHVLKDLPDGVILAIGTCVGATVYVATVWIVDRKTARQVHSTVMKSFGRP